MRNKMANTAALTKHRLLFSFANLRNIGRLNLWNKMMSSVGQTEEEEVLFETRNHVGIITLNRPKALNALNLHMIRQTLPMLRRWEEDPEIGMIVMKGAGGKAFCAGGDILAVTKAARSGDSLAQDFFKEEYLLDYNISKLQKPYVAMIDGITMGGGVGLSVHGWFRVATEKTVFAMPETAIGLFPDVGGGYFLPRLLGHLGLYLALTGFRLKGRDVHSAGIATHLIGREMLQSVEDCLVNDLPRQPHLDDVRNLLDEFHKKSSSVDSKDFCLADRLDAINKCFSGNEVEDIVAALQEDGSLWGKEQVEILSKMSPTSLKITHRQLKEGGKCLLDDCLRMEYRMSQGCISGHDFHEGVRAVLIDKDNKPVWKPAKLHEVTDKMVDQYFTPFKSQDQELDLDD